MEYHKIETFLERGNDFKVKTDCLRNPIIGQLKTWEITEKIDGTNIRVTLNPDGEIKFGGKTDNSQLPALLLQNLINTFPIEKLKSMFWKEGNPNCKVILYGEGYGAGIQKIGGSYRHDKSFRLFDVFVDDKWWLNWDAVSEISQKLNIKTVPYLGRWSLDEICSNVKNGIKSVTAKEDSGNEIIAEGIVGRTLETLYDKRMKRIIIKLKTKDF